MSVGQLHGLAALTAGLVLAPALLGAQDSAVLHRGDKVRVLVPGHVVDAWTLAGGDSAALLLIRGAKDTLSVPLDIVRRLEVSQGTTSATGLGAGIGALVGAVVAAYAGGSSSASDAGGAALRGAGIGIVAGAGVGALIGARLRADRWQIVPLDRIRIGLRVMP